MISELPWFGRPEFPRVFKFDYFLTQMAAARATAAPGAAPSRATARPASPAGRPRGPSTAAPSPDDADEPGEPPASAGAAGAGALGGNRRREHRHPAALDVILEIGLRAAERDVLARRRRPLVKLVALRGLALLRVLLPDGNRRRPLDEQRGVARLRRRPRPLPLLRLAVRAPVVKADWSVVPRQGRAPFEPVRARGLPLPFRFNGPQRELPPCVYGRRVRVGRVVDVAGRRVLRIVVD